MSGDNLHTHSHPRSGVRSIVLNTMYGPLDASVSKSFCLSKHNAIWTMSLFRVTTDGEIPELRTFSLFFKYVLNDVSVTAKSSA